MIITIQFAFCLACMHEFVTLWYIIGVILQNSNGSTRTKYYTLTVKNSFFLNFIFSTKTNSLLLLSAYVSATLLRCLDVEVYTL